MINITINGQRIKAKKGDTVLRIAESAGIKIPTLCYHKDLSPFGGCRLCIVEVKGRKAPLTACTLNAEDGMVVKTDTPRLRKLRKFTLELILSEHPNACLICERESDCRDFQECIKKSAVTFGCKSCPQNDNCELQDLVREFKVKTIPFEFRYRNLDIERYDPFFDRDYNLCILCGRCIRACEEIRHAHTLQFHHRGPDTLVGTAFDLPHLQSGCQFCGACVDVCPTGALRDRFSRYDKPPDRTVKTTCTLCSIGCTIDLKISDNKVTCSTPHNGQICGRGRVAIAPRDHPPTRATKPMIKKDGQLVEVEWEQALKFVNQRLKEHKTRTAFLFSPQLMNKAIEKVYSMADALRAKVSAPINSKGTYGSFKLTQIKGKPAFIIVNTDMVGDFSVLLLRLRKKFKDRTIFIVVGKTGNILTTFADLVLEPVPGTEHELLEVLTNLKRKSCNCGIPAAEIMRAKHLLQGRNIYLIFNNADFYARDLGKRVRTLGLNSQINASQIAKTGFDEDYAGILDNEKIDCMYLIGTAPKLSKEYKTIIVQDCFLPDFDCDVFLPTATFAEQNGTVTDIEGKTKPVRKAIDPFGKAQPDEWILENLARVMNRKLMKPKKRKRHKQTTRFMRAKTSRQYPLQLIIRENTYGFRSQPLSVFLKGFGRMRHDRYVWLNERTAKKCKLQDGMHANIISRKNVLKLPVKISTEIPDHAVLVYYHPSMGYIPNEPVRLECTK